MASTSSERETSADRPSAEALQMQEMNRIDPNLPPVQPQIIIVPFPVPREWQYTPNPARAKLAGKRKRCNKCGCQCTDKVKSPKLRPYCPTCRKHHTGECWKATGGCYRCGEVGHRVRDCPKPTRKSKKLARAQAEAAETPAAQETPSLVPALVTPVPRPKCPTCGKYHNGECWKVTGGCYRCGQLGHHLRDCPKQRTTERTESRPPTQGQAANAGPSRG